MIDQLDDALRDFLIRELPIRENEVDIAFEQPKREWSARLSRPTINLFLRDIRENTKLRTPGPAFQDTRVGDVARVLHHGLRFDLFYLVTAWAKDPLDEHRILSRMLSALFRLRAIPEDILHEHVPGQENGVPLKLAQYETQSGISDLWSVLDNEIRPAIDIVATATLQPYVDVTVPIVRSLDIRYRQISSLATESRSIFTVGRQPSAPAATASTARGGGADGAESAPDGAADGLGKGDASAKADGKSKPKPRKS